MNRKLKTILFVTSFIPVATFKVVARTGAATLEQAKWATVLGLILALAQFALSKKCLGHSTPLEKAFLGFLGVGMAWTHAVPAQMASLFVDHSTTLLYFVLFLAALIPNLLGNDPFTVTIAKQWYPETVWKMPLFRIINLHLSYVWSGLFLINSLLSYLGQGKPLFSIILPLIIVL